MTWSPIASAPRDGSDILVRRVERLADGSVEAVWHAVASYWIGLWVFQYGATSSPLQLRFEPTEWQPIADEFPAPKEEEEADATEVGEAAPGDAGSGGGTLDTGDPAESGQGV